MAFELLDFVTDNMDENELLQKKKVEREQG